MLKVTVILKACIHNDLRVHLLRQCLSTHGILPTEVYRKWQIQRVTHIKNAPGFLTRRNIFLFFRKWCLYQVKTAYLHCDKSVLHHDLLCQEVCTYSGLVLVTELFIHILVHQGGFPNTESRKQFIKSFIWWSIPALENYVINYDQFISDWDS